VDILSIETGQIMKKSILSSLIAVTALCGCSSSSSTSDVGNSSSLGAGNTLRLISEQRSIGNGNSIITSYEYDEIGNLIGSVSGGTILSYSIEPNGRIIQIDQSVDGVAAQASLIHIYDSIGGLRRIDNLASVQGVGVIGVSAFLLYKFDGDLATALEIRNIPFEEIVLNGQVDESAGVVSASIEFEYVGERLVQELIDSDSDDVVDRQREYTYNSNGTLSSVLDAGTSVRTYVYSYEQGACNQNWGNSTHRYFCVFSEGM